MIDSDVLGGYGTYRGALDGTDWLPADLDPMTWQRTGQFSRNLKRVGVKSLVVGDLKEEWYLYSIAHPIHTLDDIKHNLQRYYPDWFVEAWLKHYLLPEGEEKKEKNREDLTRLFGVILSDAQVHLPVRLLTRDLIANGFPVLRYEIRWTPEQNREAQRKLAL